ISKCALTGMVGDSWELERFSPMGAIPTSVKLTTYSGGAEDFINTPLQDFVRDIESGIVRSRVGRVFNIKDIVEAHRCMEENCAGGKIVVLTESR
ncbi:MAG: zinc-binding dehydrogenase, partial [Gammaproteobacteria bacterium]|nr:zinc-binding dehydrogenase [Gammaproteobacteria bacterium]